MPKSITSAMRSHLAQTSTSLAMCWRLERRDGQVFTFTNHDRDLRVEDQDPSGTPTGVVRTYSAETAFDRSDVEQRGDMDVGNLEATGTVRDDAVSILSSAVFNAVDIEDGLWDDCALDVFFVNHQDTGNTMGRVPGWSGFISTITKTGSSFKAEMRSKALELRTDIIELTSPLCRADLGDARCQVALGPFTRIGEVDAVIDANEFSVIDEASITLGGGPGALDDGVTWFDGIGRVSAIDETAPRGTPQRPFLITTIAGFRAIANDPYAAYALAADLDFTAEAQETADVINVDFHGWFDGRGHSITAVKLGNQATASASRALFQRVTRGGVIRRLNCVNFVSSLTGSNSESACICGDVEGLLIDCRAIGHVLSANGFVGGIAIRTSGDGLIVNCFAQGSVNDTGGSSEGAICATNGATGHQIHCYFDSGQANNGGQGTNGSEIAVPTASLTNPNAFNTDTQNMAPTLEWLDELPTGLEFGPTWDFNSSKPRVRLQA